MATSPEVGGGQESFLEQSVLGEVADWRFQARCRDGSAALINLFFSQVPDDIIRARDFCRECPVKLDCLETAIANREPWGVWGGELISDGKILSEIKRQGRAQNIKLK